MSSHANPIASYRGTSPTANRSWNMALAFQEVLTAVVRIRFGQQAVANAELFRGHIRESLRKAAQDAIGQGYAQEDVQLALYAIVALIDESVMNSHQAVFSDWPRLPLQEELFGGHVAGETFFENLQRLMSRTAFPQTADLLEVFYLCLLLGYRGRYAVAGGDLRGITESLRDKIQKIRGGTGMLAPRWALPEEMAQTSRVDPWIRKLGWTAAASFLFALVLFILFKFVLMFGISDLRGLAGQLR